VPSGFNCGRFDSTESALFLNDIVLTSTNVRIDRSTISAASILQTRWSRKNVRLPAQGRHRHESKETSVGDSQNLISQFKTTESREQRGFCNTPFTVRSIYEVPRGYLVGVTARVGWI
jgi:hypothetical protein